MWRAIAKRLSTISASIRWKVIPSMMIYNENIALIMNGKTVEVEQISRLRAVTILADHSYQ